MLGKWVAGYAVKEDSGVITYECWNPKTGELALLKECFPFDVAIRTPSGSVDSLPQLNNRLDESIERFCSVAKVCQSIERTGKFEKVIELFRENGTAYAAVARTGGISLEEHMAKTNGGKLSQAEAITLAERLVDAIHVLHNAGITHGGINPEQVEITSSGIVLTGLENAKHSHRDALRQPATEYTAPEIFQSKAHLGAWTDYYEVGAVIYRAVSGSPPQAAVSRLIKDELVPLPGKLGKAIAKAMSLKPDDRFDDARDFADALHGHLRIGVPMAKTFKFAGIAAVIIAIAVLAALGVKMVSTIASTAGEIETEVVVFWVPEKDGEKRAEAFVEVLGKLSENGHIKSSVVSVPESEYEGRLKAAAASGDAPGVFFKLAARSVQGVSLKPLLDSLDMSGYWHLDNYVKSNPNTDNIPLAFNSVVAYTLDERKETYSMGDLATGEVYIEEGCYNTFVDFYTIKSVNRDEAPFSDPRWKTLVGTTAVYGKVQDALSGDYLPYPFAKEGISGRATGMGIFEDCLAVSGKGRQQAMEAIASLLGENAQTDLYLKTGDAIPLSKAAASKYFAANSEMAFLEETLSGTLIGEASLRR
jgi:serine/threonine protein kinase